MSMEIVKFEYQEVPGVMIASAIMAEIGSITSRLKCALPEGWGLVVKNRTYKTGYPDCVDMELFELRLRDDDMHRAVEKLEYLDNPKVGEDAYYTKNQFSEGEQVMGYGGIRVPYRCYYGEQLTLEEGDFIITFSGARESMQDVQFALTVAARLAEYFRDNKEEYLEFDFEVFREEPMIEYWCINLGLLPPR